MQPADLKSRWSSEKSGVLRAAIANGSPLPRVFPPLIVIFADRKVEVEDLRGASLDGMEISDYDLAYCALNYGSFAHSRLTGTQLQYSLLDGVSFKSATLERVQASPVSAMGANFSAARIVRCFFSHSNFEGASSQGVRIEHSDFVESAHVPVDSSEKMPLAIFSGNYNQNLIAQIQNEYRRLKSGIYETQLLNHDKVVHQAYKTGVVLPKTKSGSVYVSVSGSKRITPAGKVIRKDSKYRIAASVDAFSVGDRVKISQFEINGEVAQKKLQFSKLKKRKNVARTAISGKWLILGRSKADEEDMDSGIVPFQFL